MKKITLQMFSFLCLISSLSFGQTYTSGLFNIVPNYDAQIDINVTTNIVTLTLIGPDTGWMAMGFDTTSMSNGKDVVFITGTGTTASDISDRTFAAGRNEPIADGIQNWTINSNTTSGGARTVVATRLRDTGDSNDYLFSDPPPTTLNVVGAYNSTFDTTNKHDDKDPATAMFSLLDFEDVNKIQFSMSPNPATSNLKIVLPSNLTNASVEIFDMLSRKIFDGKIINTHFSIIDVSTWGSGVYLVRVSNGLSAQTKRFVKQ